MVANEAPTCRGCGRKLRPQRAYVEPTTLASYGTREYKRLVAAAPIKGWGYASNGFYCTMRCGFRAAVNAARGR